MAQVARRSSQSLLHDDIPALNSVIFSSIAAGRRWGVAKEANIISVVISKYDVKLRHLTHFILKSFLTEQQRTTHYCYVSEMPHTLREQSNSTLSESTA